MSKRKQKRKLQIIDPRWLRPLFDETYKEMDEALAILNEQDEALAPIDDDDRFIPIDEPDEHIEKDKKNEHAFRGRKNTSKQHKRP